MLTAVWGTRPLPLPADTGDARRVGGAVHLDAHRIRLLRPCPSACPASATTATTVTGVVPVVIAAIVAVVAAVVPVVVAAVAAIVLVKAVVAVITVLVVGLLWCTPGVSAA